MADFKTIGWHRYKASWVINSQLIIMIIIVCTVAACERNTHLKITSDNPPGFVMSGSGKLARIRVRGPKVREALGEDKYIVWEIKSQKGYDGEFVEELGPVTYGQVPPGYVQIYPEQGEAPPLVEGERYNIRVATNNANGADKFFTLHNGKVTEESK
ncbi:MAG: hypothetical protein U0Z53_13505 [Blastocatellia bacterium]